MISGYLSELADTLSFDRALARCVVREVEDHLCEAIAADRARDGLDAERRAIANFGDPHRLAAEFAIVSLARQTRRVGVAIVLAIASVLVAMQARLAWYQAVQWTMSEDAKALGAIVLAIDRCAFWLAVVLGAGALGYILYHRRSAALYPEYSKHYRRASLLCAGAAGSLIVSVTSDGVLTALRVGTDLCAGALIPIVSVAVEIACAGAVIFLISRTMRRAACTQALLKM
jgi:hypothetical protein